MLQKFYRLFELVIYFLLDLLICNVYYPCLFICLFPFYLYRVFVTILAKLIDPSLTPIQMNDHLVAWDLLSAERQSRPMVFNIGCALCLDGKISLEEVQQKYTRSLLDPVTLKGEKLYAKLFKTLTLFGGHAFFKPVEDFDINQKIIKLEPKSLKAMDKFTKDWMSQYYPEGSPPWEVVIVPIEGENQTKVLFKWHHAILDGLNLIHFMNVLMDSKVPVSRARGEPEDSFTAKLRQAIRAPRLFVAMLGKINKSKAAFSSLKTWNDYPEDYVSSKVTLYFSDIKLIQRKTGAKVTAVNLALFTGVFSKVLENRLGHDYVHVAVPLPMPNHPIQKMCNHWVGGTMDLPLKAASALDRVKMTEAMFQKYLDSELHKIIIRFIFPLASIIPILMYQRFIEFSRRTFGLRVLFSTMANFAEGFYELEGRPVISIEPLFGLYGTVSGACFCYQDRCEFVLHTTKEFARNQENLDNVVHNHLVDEVENLVTQLTKS